jgi:hypothetical protein
MAQMTGDTPSGICHTCHRLTSAIHQSLVPIEARGVKPFKTVLLPRVLQKISVSHDVELGRYLLRAQQAIAMLCVNISPWAKGLRCYIAVSTLRNS